MKAGFVYIMTNKNHTILYTGVTSNLPKRVQQHKDHIILKALLQDIICIYWCIGNPFRK
ncbi:GIY-YIG nuclease family protein [Chryseobacterium sp. RRHN12]|uniref:GIY-YIG nuclease family protein n=1 Tax=Chryseobacterium sp. RRHN12 TaxID=3437884 RepID=UPI003D9AFADA